MVEAHHPAPDAARMTNKSPDLRVLFGQRVRELRRHRGLSLAALGERSGVDGKYLQCVETAKKSATLDTIAKIAHGLDVQAADLLTFTEERPTAARARAARLLRAVSDEDVRKIARVLEALATR